MVASDAFAALAGEAARSRGLPDARMVQVAHPIGGVGEAALRRRAETVLDAVLGALTGSGGRPGGA